MDALSKLNEEAAAYLDESHRSKGLGRWRTLYADLLRRQPLDMFGSIVELGAGAPDFLKSLNVETRLAVDVGDRYRKAFEQDGIAFRQADLERAEMDAWGRFDVAVCSDVFEHLLYPHLVLDKIGRLLTPRGFLFSHVPNEYSLKKTLKVMVGRRNGLYFHTGETEWTDPHLRRFTDIGYRQFLALTFGYNIRLTPCGYRRTARMLARAGMNVPYCLEPGPTYASTNDPDTVGLIEQAVAEHVRETRR